VQPSSIRQAIGKMPLLHGFSGHNAGEEFVPANPIEVPVPTQASAGNALKKGNTIEMLAKVDREGNVESVKLVDGNRQLADTSAEAILRWRFEPARQNGTPVDSSMRIRFEFPTK
jgi:TonB family protein